MELLNHCQSNRDRWQLYKKLELLPDGVNDTPKNIRYLTVFSQLWRWFIKLLIDELVDPEQQIEYLERCGSLDPFGKGERSPSNSLQRLWLLMN